MIAENTYEAQEGLVEWYGNERRWALSRHKVPFSPYTHSKLGKTKQGKTHSLKFGPIDKCMERLNKYDGTDKEYDAALSLNHPNDLGTIDYDHMYDSIGVIDPAFKPYYPRFPRDAQRA